MEQTVTEDSSTASALATTVVRQTTTVSCECKVCGAPARYSYYGAIVCYACKVFFKRNAANGQVVLKCHFDNNCDTNINNRRICASCRLAKCFANGMQTELIRSSYSTNNERNEKEGMNTDSIPLTSTALVTVDKQYQSEQILTSNLLQSDQSTLSIDQWNLISNLVNCFDEHSGYSSVEHFIQEQKTLPLKLRFKYSSVSEFFTLIMGKVQFVFEKNRDFLSLSLHERTILLRSTVEYTASIGGMFILRQTKLLDDLAFFESTEMIFQPAAMAFIKRVIDQLDPDDTFIKLILAILAFSTINYTVYTKFSPTNLTNIKAILPTQNMYTELTWRYLLHKYGHHEAVIRFSNVIRCLFLVNKTIVEAYEAQQFIDIIDSVIKQTEQKLIQ